MNVMPGTSELRAITLALACFTVAAGAQSDDARRQWPQWRGPLATGVAPEADPPLEWSETRNVKWKVKIPGSGTSTPIVWGERVFILTAVKLAKPAQAAPTESSRLEADELLAARDSERQAGYGSEQPVLVVQASPPEGQGQPRPRPGGGGFGRSEKPVEAYQFTVLCYDRQTGKILWQKVARQEVPHEGHHRDHGFASASPVTDGQLLIAYFGSRGLHGYDLEGNLKWSKDFGDMQTRNSFGEGASPVLQGNRVVVNWDDETDNDFIAAFDKRTGKELWKTPRSDDTSWSTPLIVEHNQRYQVVVNATRKVRSYDLETGKELWSCAGQTANAIPSPVADRDTVYITSGFRGSALFALALGRTGDLNGTDAVRWSYNRNTPYVPSPLLVDSQLYLVKGNEQILSSFDVRAGQSHFEAERLTGLNGVYASPVSAKDRVYVLGRNGVCAVLKKGPKPEVLATNTLEDRTDASIAMVGRELFIRGHQNLYCLAAN
jgi:outer membrane protein assembly factor BamB